MIVLMIVAVIAIIVITALVVAWTVQRRNKLRGQFGPEYDRAVKDHGNRRAAERDLHDRQSRVEDLDIRPLNPADRDAYHAEWTRVQERFVDTPEDALSDADKLLQRVMTDRGYQTRDYQQQVADLSVEHARTLQHYRTAHDISARAADKQASTEELRQAMVHYRVLFEDLLTDTNTDTGSDSGTERGTAETESDPQPQTAAGHPQTPRKG